MARLHRLARLHRVARLGKAEEVAPCVAAGADVNAPGLRGLTPLMIAAQEGDVETVTALLAAGATPGLAHADGRTPLHLAAWGGHLGVVELLAAAGADVNAERRGGSTPALEAGEANRAEVVAYLLAHGADAQKRCARGLTAEDWIAEGGAFGRMRRLSPTFARFFDKDNPPDARPAAEAKLAELMAECPDPDEFAARHGRRILVWSYGVYRYQVPERGEWARRVSEVLRSPELLRACEEKLAQQERSDP